MRKTSTLLIGLVCTLNMLAQERMLIHKTDKISVGTAINNVDEVTFSSDGTTANFSINGSVTQYPVSSIDSVTFDNNANTIYVKYNGTSASVINPLAFEGVTVSVSGANVTITATNDTRDINYSLSGTSSNGSFKIYSSKRFFVLLNGVTLTNPSGPAINIQSNIKAFVTLVSGTTNTLCDGTTYATAPNNSEGVAEDQKATFFSEGQLVFDGTGTLNLSSLSKNAICSDNYVEIANGTINVTSASKDGIHGKDGCRFTGGTVTVTATSDAIDGDEGNIVVTGGVITAVTASANVNAMRCDSTLLVEGGTLKLTAGGNQSKGMVAGQAITLTGGNVTINTSGATVLKASGLGYNPSYCTAIKSDSTITVNGANIVIACTGAGGKGISTNKDFVMTSGLVNITTSGSGATYTNDLGAADAYAASAIDADGKVNILGGTVITNNSGAGGKGISCDGALTIGSSSTSPSITVTNTGTRFLISGSGITADYANPKAIKSTGAMAMYNGVVTISTSQIGGDGLDSESTLNVAGGTLDITIGGNETKGIKATGIMTLSGGTIGVKTTGGVSLIASGSGYDVASCTAIKGDVAVNLTGSNITITSSGAGGKGIASDTDVNMTAGVIKITTSGTGTTYKNTSAVTDSYSASSLSANGNLLITGGTLITESSGAGGKGLSADGTITIGSSSSSPSLSITTSGAKFLVSGTDYCHPKGIRCTGAFTYYNGTTTVNSSDDGVHSDASFTQHNGTLTVTNSYEGIESKIITFNGGKTYVTATNDGLNSTFSTLSGGTETNDGSYIYFSGGYVVTNCTSGDAIDSNGNIVMTAGVVIANGPLSGVEEAADFNGTFNMNGGFFIGAGSSSTMTKAMSTSSTQRNMFISSSSAISSSTLLHIQNASGTDIVTFLPKYGGYKFLFSAPTLTSGASYSIYTGGTCSGTSTDGLYSGGTYTGGTLKKTVTLSTSSTVNSTSF